MSWGAASSTSPWAFHHRLSRPFVGSRGCAWLRRSPGFEQLDIQLGPNAHPALRNKLVRRALAYGIDRTALVRQIWGEIDPSARALDSAVYLTQSRDYEPNWGTTAIDRRRPAACSSKPAAAEEQTGSSPAADSGSRCAS